MYRVTRMSQQVFAVQFSEVSDVVDDLEGLLEAGDHVLLVNELDEAAGVFDVDVSDIIIVEPD